jgi:REP element-mobilizing transposase RayT
MDMNTIARKDAPDTVWHITSRVNWRAWHLGPEEACRAFLECLSEALKRFCVDLLAYVVMSNHYHAVVRSPGEEVYRQLTGRRTRCRHFHAWPARHPQSTVIGQCMRELQLSVGRRIQGTLGLAGHFWEGKHHRRRLEDTWALVTAIAYDHRNPVVQGMAPRPEDYARSSAAWWAMTGPSAIPLCTREDLPFGTTLEDLRSRIVEFQRNKRLDDVMTVFEKSRLPIDSAKGRRYLERLMREAGLDPLHPSATPPPDKRGTRSARQPPQVVQEQAVAFATQVNR